MTDLQILTQAIQKAKKNGYRYTLEYDDENGKYYAKMLDLKKYYSIIFDHDFAKAFWYEKCYSCNGHRETEDSKCMVCDSNGQVKYKYANWPNHLSEMAKCKEPLQYIKYYLGE